MKREHLLHFFPFLKKEFRKLELAEITSEDVFKELFGEDKVDLSKLNAIYHYQNIEPKTITHTIEEPVIVFTDKQKKKRNGKV